MSRRSLTILGIVALMGISALAGVGVYIVTVGGSGEASQPLSAPTIDLSTPTPNALATQISDLSTEVAQLEAANATLSAASGIELSIPATPTPQAEAASQTGSSAAGLFRIVPEESEVRFTIMEDLLGKPNLVIGRTNDVAGDILVDTGTPANSKVGGLRIRVRSLTTDSELRNRAIRSQILQSSRPEYEFADFTPTALTGLPDKIEMGQAIQFQIVGDLKIRDITQPVTFDVTATLVSESRLEGSAKATVTRTQYNLTIPNAPGVANVAEEVGLEIDFVATKVQQ